MIKSNSLIPVFAKLFVVPPFLATFIFFTNFVVGSFLRACVASANVIAYEKCKEF